MLEAQVHLRTVKVPWVEGTDIRFRRLSTAAGLSQTRAEQIVQDDQGFMWFGTQFGLNRYDGYSFRVFTPNPGSANSISGGYIYSLFKDRSNILWIGCNQFLDRFDPRTESFTHYRLESEDSDSVPVTVHHITQDRSGTLWLGTASGLYGLDTTTGRIIRHYTHDPMNPSTLSVNEIKSVGADRSGNLLVADGDELEQLDQQTGKVIWRRSLPGLVRNNFLFHEDRFGKLWIDYATNGEPDGLAVLDRDANELTYYWFYDQKSGKRWPLSLSAMLEDTSGSFWLATTAGLLKFEQQTGKAIRYHHHSDDPESLDDDRVIALERDREGNIWVGLHAREPNFFASRKPSFTPILRESLTRNPVGEHMVNAIFEDRHGALWVGVPGALIRTDRKTEKYTSYQLNDDVLSIAEDSAGVIWVGTGSHGLYRFDSRTGIFKGFPPNPSSSKSYRNAVLRLFIDHTGAMWLATRNDLERFDTTTGQFAVYKRIVHSRTEEYFDIAEDHNGRLWLAGNGGLQRFDPASGKFTGYEHQLDNPRSLSDNAVSSVLVDHSGSVWAATYNGPSKLDEKSGTFTNYYAKDGLPSSRVSCILEDEQGALWLSTARGISRFDPLAKTFKNYSVADGLPGMDLTGWVTSFKNSSGEMFFGGFSGAIAFFPDKVVDSSYVPPVVFTDFLLSGHAVSVGADSPLKKSINYTDALTLSHGQNNFSLEFAALSYSSPSMNRYRYRMDDLDSRWNDVAADQRVVNYSTLAPGKYTLRVQASTERGVWNAPGAILYIEVLPPWWKAWWFHVISLAMGLALLWGLYQVRLRQLQQEFDIGLEARVNERTRIARDLHDTLLQALHGLMFKFQAARNMLPRRPEDAMRTLDTAISETEQAIVEGRDAILDLRTQPVSDEDLAPLLEAAGEELAAVLDANQTSPNFRVIAEGESHRLSPDMQDEIYRIAREVLRNAFQHAGAGQIEVEIRYDKNHLRVRIRDDGKGIDPQVLEQSRRPGHWGLPGVRERAERIGSQLKFWSQAGAGTEVELTIPAAVAYGSDHSARRLRLVRKDRKP